MALVVSFEERVEIPLDLGDLAAFRRWVLSEKFPESGRIDFISGRIEVDMSPEDFFCHGTLKGEIYASLLRKVKQDALGHLVTDSTRISVPEAELSAEPDVVFVTNESLAEGRVRLVPKSGGQEGRFVEVEGPPELVVEIVSDSSVQKDTQRLPVAYYRAGVREFWLADARGEALVFQIHRRAAAAYEPCQPDDDGFQASEVFACRFRLDRGRDAAGYPRFDLFAK